MTGADKISRTEFATIASLMRELSGVTLADGKRAMVAARLGRRVRALRLGGFAEYCSLVTSPEGAAERDELIKALTTNTTRFNREQRQLDHFASEVLPGLVARARSGGRVRLWSAGCSTGEEPYSLTFRVLDQCRDAASLDFKILATDIDQQVLDHARAATYARSALDVIDPDHLARYFEPETPGAMTRKVAQQVRAMVSFGLLNLLQPWPFKGPFDMIMCRNVFIYFDRETQDRLWPRLARMLAEGGILYIGHSETISEAESLGLRANGHGMFRMQNQPGLAPAAQAATMT
ncbi:protein-glutamate O-methyltransferase [Seohaeicola saemankumensis]|nr:protein-glutamate O-methyltransferase [Seohaeicola saemankumensis]MCA0872271.1 protein-glutamate O-methyltransferase [Seohaeicola saemankumensis]